MFVACTVPVSMDFDARDRYYIRERNLFIFFRHSLSKEEFGAGTGFEIYRYRRCIRNKLIYEKEGFEIV
jgi:hypothetical protein